MKISTATLLVASLSFAADAKVKAPKYTDVKVVTSAPNPSKIIPQPAGKSLQGPAGFVVEEFASGLDKPRAMTELPGGTVLVSESTAKGKVTAITNGQKKTIISEIDRPFGLTFHAGYLYVTAAEAIHRYKLDPKTLEIGKDEVIIKLAGYGKGHWTRGIAVDAKANKLYVSIGSGSNVDEGDPADRNAVNRYNLDGTGAEIFATGLRNPVGIHFQPTSHKLWTTVQERDGLGDELPPDFFTEVKQGAFYGWPYAFIGPNEEPRHKGKAPEKVKATVVPDVLLPSHTAAMDFAFYTGKTFPAKYRNGAFIAYRGSSGKTPRTGYALAFVPFKGGKPSGPPEEFVTGWMLSPNEKEVWGRPVGVVSLADGSVLVSEDGNNKIYRVKYTGK